MLIYICNAIMYVVKTINLNMTLFCQLLLTTIAKLVRIEITSF